MNSASSAFIARLRCSSLEGALYEVSVSTVQFLIFSAIDFGNTVSIAGVTLPIVFFNTFISGLASFTAESYSPLASEIVLS